MEYEFNENESINEQAQLSEGDSITIDNNDYEKYSEDEKSAEKDDENEEEGDVDTNIKKRRKIEKKKKVHRPKKSNDEELNLEQENNPLKADLQEKLNKVFLNYSKFNVQEENFILTHQFFMKIMKDCGLLREKYEKPKENTLTAEEIDITLKKVCPNNASLNTQQFIDFFVALSKRLNPQEFNKSPKITVQKTVDGFLGPIVQNINEDQEGKFRYNKVEQSVLATSAEGVDEKTEKIMKRIYPGLLNAYKLYFPQEYNYKGISIEKIIKESLKSLGEFNIDFDLSKFLTREKLAIYYNCIYLLEQKNLVFSSEVMGGVEEGKIFTFDKFAFYLLCLANDIIPEDQFPQQWQKVSLLIKCLSDSNGEETMSKKFGVKITDDKGIYLDDQIINELIKEEEEAKRLQKEQESPDEVLTEKEKYVIEKIFYSYADKDKMTQGKITITPYFNILKDLGIFEIEKENGELVNRKDAEMALTQVSRKKNVKPAPISMYRAHNALERNTQKVISKLDFDMFIKSLQELSLRIYPSLKMNQAFTKLMQQKIDLLALNFDSDYEKIKDTYSDIKRKIDSENDFSDIMVKFVPVFKEIFDNYKDYHKDTISWQNYLLFCKDFNIISDWSNITAANTIFNGLSKIYTSEKKISDTGLLDFNFFLYSIPLFALQNDSEQEDESKLISLFLTMQPSKGIQNPRDTGKGMYITYQNKFRNKLRRLKTHYPNYFNNGEPDDIKATSFNKIFSK